jgi:hypothetical protein
MAFRIYLYSYCMVLFHFFYRIDGEHWVHQCLTTVRMVRSRRWGFTGMDEEDINTQIKKTRYFYHDSAT